MDTNTSISNEELRDVLSRVAKWSSNDRIRLARMILESVESASRARRGFSAEEVIAQLDMPQPAPSDEECRQTVEEELVRKHVR